MADQQPEAQPAPAAPEGPRSRAEIAKELFGNEFYGEKPEEKIEETKPSDTQEGEEAPPIEEPTEEEGETPEGETAPEEDTGETPIETVSELVEHLETNPEWFNGLKVPVTVDGTPTEATIGDLVKSYQIIQAAEHRLTDAKTVAQKESEAWAAKQAGLDAQFHVLADMIKHEEQILERDERAVDPHLRETDPAEWAARSTEFGQRRAHIERMKFDSVEKYRANAAAQTAQAQAVRDVYTAEQAQVLLQKLPEWQDVKRADTEKAQIADYLVRSGFEQRELADLIDHRHLLLVRKAWLYDQSRGQVDAARKKVAKVPKVMKPGAPKPAEQRAAERIAGLKAKLSKTGSVEDALAYRLATKRGVR